MDMHKVRSSSERVCIITIMDKTRHDKTNMHRVE